MSSIEDISQLLHIFDVKAESKKTEDGEDAKLRRFKEKWLFITTQILVIAVFVICAVFTFLSFESNSPYTGIA